MDLYGKWNESNENLAQWIFIISKCLAQFSSQVRHRSLTSCMSPVTYIHFLTIDLSSLINQFPLSLRHGGPKRTTGNLQTFL